MTDMGGAAVSSYSVNTEGCRNIFTGVDSDCDLANTKRGDVESTVNDLIVAAKHAEFKAAVTKLRDETILPAMDSALGKMGVATYYGSTAVGHVAAGDAEMKARSDAAAANAVEPDMPGVIR